MMVSIAMVIIPVMAITRRVVANPGGRAVVSQIDRSRLIINSRGWGIDNCRGSIIGAG